MYIEGQLQVLISGRHIKWLYFRVCLVDGKLFLANQAMFLSCMFLSCYNAFMYLQSVLALLTTFSLKIRQDVNILDR